MFYTLKIIDNAHCAQMFWYGNKNPDCIPFVTVFFFCFSFSEQLRIIEDIFQPAKVMQ